MGNGGTERFNRTLGNMLRSLPPRSKQRWPQLVQTMTFVYNCTAHETTGFAPFYLMFGRVPRLPVDLMFQSVLRDESICDYSDYVQSLVGDLQSAMALAQKNSTAEQKHQSDQYNKRVKGLPLSVGDHVLVANKGCRGKRKLADKWEPTMYSVVASKPSLHIYKIRDRSGHEKVVHRNLLLPVNFLPLPSTDISVDDGATGAPCSTSSQSVCDVAESTLPVTDDLSHIAVCDDDRTASWVSSHSSPSVSEAQNDLPVDHDTVTSASFSTVPVPSSSHDPMVDNHPDDRYTTRLGRVIKPVRRLIESMVQLETLLGIDSLSPVIHV
ncbi:uncharacterized protein LOC120490097 [Pimephales promelas]|uniref:uncharacterized protein LOC120490097 n=1 Tax=Pimephales promelas TaxID=90988 RepID=UPI001955DC63|nr:uncharacterized protein LOC120490097 [Pimephales promelas]XP_039543417.1 uncharacterized protein LOC120490097 [Pimephales promelas]